MKSINNYNVSKEATTNKWHKKLDLKLMNQPDKSLQIENNFFIEKTRKTRVILILENVRFKKEIDFLTILFC